MCAYQRVVFYGLILLAGRMGFGSLQAGSFRSSIPYPDVLRESAVRIADVDPSDVTENLRTGLVVGNGHMNAIVYVSGNDLMIRISKNDVWDGRIDTSEDPSLPRVDPAEGKLYREKPGNPPSWNKPYPCAVPCADIRLAGLDNENGWEMMLDLEKAAATVTTSTETTTIRALAQTNVILINSRRSMELIGVPQAFLPSVQRGSEDGDIVWLCQQIPGDEDVKGMHVFLVAAKKGMRQVVSVVTSNETADPLERGIELVECALARTEQELVKDHEAVWSDFWSRSGLRLDDKQLQNWWYRMVYFFRCFSCEQATAVGLKAAFDSLAGWHNSYKFNYNIQQAYFSAGPINHPELADPLIEVLNNYWPRAQWFAKTCFVGCEGAFVHSDVFHPHEPDPAVCTTLNRHQFAYIPWGYSLGMQGHISFMLWEAYQYRPDRERLKNKLYPMLRDIALFYCSFLEQCRKDDNGKILIGPSYIPENFYFGQYNTAYDIPFISYGLQAAKEAACVLKTDEDLVKRIDAILTRMPTYKQVPDPLQDNRSVVTYFRGVKEFPADDRHGSLIMGVFPAGQVTWRSPMDQQELFRRTINLVGRITTHANSPVTLNIARARLGMVKEAMKNILIDFTQHHKPLRNGLFSWKAHGYYISEQAGIARMITELLVQSEGNIIRVFPAWPSEKDAEFAGLRTQGGFLISAAIKNGSIATLSIDSSAGGELKVCNPWRGDSVRIVDKNTGDTIAHVLQDDIMVFQTQAQQSFTIFREPDIAHIKSIGKTDESSR